MEENYFVTAVKEYSKNVTATVIMTPEFGDDLATKILNHKISKHIKYVNYRSIAIYMAAFCGYKNISSKEIVPFIDPKYISALRANIDVYPDGFGYTNEKNEKRMFAIE